VAGRHQLAADGAVPVTGAAAQDPVGDALCEVYPAFRRVVDGGRLLDALGLGSSGHSHIAACRVSPCFVFAVILVPKVVGVLRVALPVPSVGGGKVPLAPLVVAVRDMQAQSTLQVVGLVFCRLGGGLGFGQVGGVLDSHGKNFF